MGKRWPQDRHRNPASSSSRPGYFETMGTRMIAGRSVTWSDIETGGHVAVISEDFARELAMEPADAVGKRIRFAAFSQNPWREVIGVVQSIHEGGLYEAPPSMVYWPVLTENMFNNPTCRNAERHLRHP